LPATLPFRVWSGRQKHFVRQKLLYDDKFVTSIPARWFVLARRLAVKQLIVLFVIATTSLMPAKRAAEKPAAATSEALQNAQATSALYNRLLLHQRRTCFSAAC
jgi:hypothetical protein